MTDSSSHDQVELLRSVLDGRRFVAMTDVLVSSAMVARRLHELGVEDVLVVGGGRGTGEIDPEVERDALVLGVSGDGFMDGIRAFERLLADPPAALVDAVETFDPVGDAWVLTAPYSHAERVCGRLVFGARSPEWRALEDKTRSSELWDEAGIERAPARIVPAEPDHLDAAAAALDAGLGTVWVADNRRGWHGGADALRWVHDGTDGSEALAFMAANAQLVRVMPFLDGMPCSIHGWVIGDEVAVFAPVEMVVYRVPGQARLRYAGAATTWRPRLEDREAMRAAARRLGAHLRDTVGYRGIFTLDGILTADGFRPTELNPRFGVGIAVLARGTDLPLYLLHCATVERPDLDWRAGDLEARILAAAEREPQATAHLPIDDRIDTQRSLAIVHDDDRVDRAPDEKSATGKVELGPSPGGGMLRVSFDRLPAGVPAAPYAARAFAYAAAEFDLDLPELVPAPNLRPGHA